jgi:sulfur-oxidizing protein SoxX
LTSLADTSSAVDAAKVEATLKAGWPNSNEEWKKRLEQDETMKVCSATKNQPSKEQFKAIETREKAAIKYPEDGKLTGDWKEGEKIAQSGYGMRFTDYPPKNPTGGNCYACHQLTQAELSYGTIGPPLRHYGKLRDFSAEATKALYEKIYNPHVVFPCTNMPRFGTSGILSIDQIKHLVALLMDPESPVNK